LESLQDDSEYFDPGSESVGHYHRVASGNTGQRLMNLADQLPLISSLGYWFWRDDGRGSSAAGVRNGQWIASSAKCGDSRPGL